MDQRTVETYERVAVEYGERRRATDPDRARGFAEAIRGAGVLLDLGCGPGLYVPHLGRPLVAVDAAVAMLAEARRRHPGLPLVAGDVEALPIRRGALAGVWASKCLQHVPAVGLPMALAQLHRALEVGGVLDVAVFDDMASEAPGGEDVTGEDDDFPGRLFSFWSPAALGHLLAGAGFTVDEIGAGPPQGGIRRVVARATRARTLPDTVGPGMRLLVCGLNPSLYAADAGIGFARRSNRFWAAALAAGIVSSDRDPDAALRRDGVGMTDIVKRATVAADELRVGEYRAGLVRLRHLVGWLRPRAICFVGLAGWRAAVDRRAGPGIQPRRLGGVPVYVMPSTSGLNAHARPAGLAGHLRAAAALADAG